MQVMFPLILVSDNAKQTEKFVGDYRKKNQILKSHVFHIFPLKKEISINQIRMIKRETSILATRLRLFVLYNFDYSSLAAQNAFLKLLEEQSVKNRFILVVGNEHALLPTILSRTVTLSIKNDRTAKFMISRETSALADLVISSPSPNFLNKSLIVPITRDKAILFMAELINFFRNRIGRNGKTTALILKKLLQHNLLLKINNINPQLAVDNTLIFIWKQFRIKL